MKKCLVVFIITAIVFGIGGFLLAKTLYPQEKCINVKVENNDTKEDEPTKENLEKKDLIGHTFRRTYNINHIAYSNSEEYLYITIREFQGEEIETVRVNRSQFESANVGDNYEILFEITNNDIEDNIKSIFNNTKIVSAKKTDKTGLEQEYDNIE
jgi:lipopolysaccharide export LptBFGC system permease protein LptF